MSERKSWADIQDEEEALSIPVVISKHGIKVKYTPPHQRPLKSQESIESKKDVSQVSGLRRGVQ